MSGFYPIWCTALFTCFGSLASLVETLQGTGGIDL